MICCYGGASEAVSARIGSAWKKFRELSSLLAGKQGLSLKQQGKNYQCCVRPVLLCCWGTWELTVVDEARLHGVEHCGWHWLIGSWLIFRIGWILLYIPSFVVLFSYLFTHTSWFEIWMAFFHQINLIN